MNKMANKGHAKVAHAVRTGAKLYEVIIGRPFLQSNFTWLVATPPKSSPDVCALCGQQ
jgi:hypothetical protein